MSNAPTTPPDPSPETPAETAQDKKDNALPDPAKGAEVVITSMNNAKGKFIASLVHNGGKMYTIEVEATKKLVYLERDEFQVVSSSKP
jgi:hypothetical protein